MLFHEKRKMPLQRVKSGLKHSPKHFLIFQYCCSSSPGNMCSLDQCYYPAPGWRSRKLCSLVSICLLLSLQFHFSFTALISGLLCCSYFSLGLFYLGGFLLSLILTHSHHCWHKPQPGLEECAMYTTDKSRQAKFSSTELSLLVGG